MRQPSRQHGRYASLSGWETISYPEGHSYSSIVVDQEGLPVPHVTEYYKLRRLEPGSSKTIETYFGLIQPPLAYFIANRYSWTANPEQIREYFLQFLTHVLHCQVSPDTSLEGYFVEPTNQTPLSMSSLRCLYAALRDFYHVMTDARYYPYNNPMESQLLTNLRKVYARTRAETSEAWNRVHRHESYAGRLPNAFFRASSKEAWKLDPRLSLPTVMGGIANAVDYMLHDRRLTYRDRSVIGLLRFTGARASEITDMTVGGYRSFTHDGVVGQAKVKNKGSNGREKKTLHFEGADGVQHLLLHYLRRERPALDPQHRRNLSDLPDDTPLFLTNRHTPYSYETFRWHWRSVYRDARKLCPLDFSPHDLRHLLVTELLAMKRLDHKRESFEYDKYKRAISEIMGWANPDTIEIYDHALDTADALGDLATLQYDIAHRSRQRFPLSTEYQSNAEAVHNLDTVPQMISASSTFFKQRAEQRKDNP